MAMQIQQMAILYILLKEMAPWETTSFLSSIFFIGGVYCRVVNVKCIVSLRVSFT